MRDKWITIAIVRNEQAKQMKEYLETHHIATQLCGVDKTQNDNEEELRVRIKNSKLKEALELVDKFNKGIDAGSVSIGAQKSRRVILIPNDFSDYSLRAIEISFHLAAAVDCDIVILHAKREDNIPFFANPFAATSKVEETQHTRNQLNTLNNHINNKIRNHELPLVQYSQIVCTGIPEDVIIETAQTLKPLLVVMGTRGENKKEEELIGSVTAEVIEHCESPVLAIPESCELRFIKQLQMLFVANFNEHALVNLDLTLQLLKDIEPNIYLSQIEQKQGDWNEVMMAGIQQYIQQHYPYVHTTPAQINANTPLEEIDSFISANNISLLVLATHRRTLLARLFNPSLARKMVFHATTPVLVFHV